MCGAVLFGSKYSGFTFRARICCKPHQQETCEMVIKTLCHFQSVSSYRWALPETAPFHKCWDFCENTAQVI